MVEALGGIRTLLRIAAFASSLGMLAVIPIQGTPGHPARKTAIVALGVMLIGLLHPTASVFAGMAHWFLNVAVWAPLFWAARVVCTARTMRNLLILLWLFNLTGAVVGVLQVYFPERFSPSTEFVRNLLGVFADGLLIERSDGKQIWRPFGLSDSPGGAAVSGSFAVVAGVFLMTFRTKWYIRYLAVVGIGVGVFCIYVCGVRFAMVTTALGVLVLLLIQTVQGRLTRAASLLIVIPVVTAGAIGWTQSISGDRVTERVNSLGEGSASTIYYKNRGKFIEQSLLEELPKYPLGAGMGRYGMMVKYFGDKRSTLPPLWAEVQLTGWLYDGGLPLVLLAYGAVFGTFFVTLRIAVSRKFPAELSDFAAVITALNVGWIAASFNFPFFHSQTGILFWMLNAVLFSAAQCSLRPQFAVWRGVR